MIHTTHRRKTGTEYSLVGDHAKPIDCSRDEERDLRVSSLPPYSSSERAVAGYLLLLVLDRPTSSYS